MFCKNLLKRQKNYKPFWYCKIKRQQIILPCDKKCSEFEIKRNKPIKKVSEHKEHVTTETYQQVYDRDKGRCQLCGISVNLHLHHINGRGKDLTNNINNCIMLCQNCTLNIVHKNQKKYRPILLRLLEKNK